MLPSRSALRICFAHVAYPLHAAFQARNPGIHSVQANTAAELAAALPETDVLVVSGLWRNDLIAGAGRLRFIQSIGAGTDQFDRSALSAARIRLASAAGVNANAVSEHALALILALTRRIPEARDNQARHIWRGMIADPTAREDELGGKTMIVVGLGRIGGRLARLGKALDMRIIGIRAHPQAGPGDADEVHGLDALPALLARADIVALTCPLTPQTTGLIGAAAFTAMKPTALLINCARGKVVDEAALLNALRTGQIAAAGIDVTHEEPLAPTSHLWDQPNVLITPHSAGETRRYEENLDRLWAGAAELRNQIL